MNSKQKPDRQWTTAEVAAYLHTDQYFVRYLANAGLIPVTKVHSRCWRFDPESVRQAAERLGLRISEASTESTTTA